jgi:hypothetical protein
VSELRETCELVSHGPRTERPLPRLPSQTRYRGRCGARDGPRRASCGLRAPAVLRSRHPLSQRRRSECRVRTPGPPPRTCPSASRLSSRARREPDLLLDLQRLALGEQRTRASGSRWAGPLSMGPRGPTCTLLADEKELEYEELLLATLDEAWKSLDADDVVGLSGGGSATSCWPQRLSGSPQRNSAGLKGRFHRSRPSSTRRTTLSAFANRRSRRRRWSRPYPRRSMSRFRPRRLPWM